MKTKMEKEQKVRIAKAISLLLLAIITILIAYSGIVLSVCYLHSINWHNESVAWMGLLLFLIITGIGILWIESRYSYFQTACVPAEKMAEYLEKCKREYYETLRQYNEEMPKFYAFLQILKENGGVK